MFFTTHSVAKAVGSWSAAKWSSISVKAIKTLDRERQFDYGLTGQSMLDSCWPEILLLDKIKSSYASNKRPSAANKNELKRTFCCKAPQRSTTATVRSGPHHDA